MARCRIHPTASVGTDKHYELVDGKLVAMPPEDRINPTIVLFLLARLLEVFPEDGLCYTAWKVNGDSYTQ